MTRETECAATDGRLRPAGLDLQSANGIDRGRRTGTGSGAGAHAHARDRARAGAGAGAGTGTGTGTGGRVPRTITWDAPVSRGAKFGVKFGAILFLAALCGVAHGAADLSPDLAPDLAPGLVGEYFTYKTNGYIPDLPHGAVPFLVRVDKQVNFPDPGTGGDFHHTKLVYNFAVRWNGVLRIDRPGDYAFFTQSDDGARLTIDGNVLIENDGPHPLSEKSTKTTVHLSAGDHPIKLEFAQGGGGSAILLLWQPPGGEKQLVPADALAHAKATEAVAWDKEAWVKFEPGGSKGQASAKQVNSPWGRMDYGPFLSHTIGSPQPANNMTLKGVAVKLDGGKAGVLFDTQLLRMSAAWTGGFLKLTGVAFDGNHGPSPEVAGDLHLSTSPGPGWARPGTTDFKDPRAKPFGPLPKDWMH